MSDIDTLEKIKKKESEAQEQLDKANKQAVARIEEAKSFAEKSLRDAERKAKAAYDNAMKSAGNDAAERAAEIKAEWEKKIAALTDIDDKDAIDLFAKVVGREFGV